MLKLSYDASTGVNQVEVGGSLRGAIKDRGEIICNNPAVRGNLAHLGVKENINGKDRSEGANN